MSDDGVPETPLSVLLQAMRDKWLAGDIDGAATLARAAAPYIHARRSASVGHFDQRQEAHRLNDAELARQLALLAGGDRVTDQDPDFAGSVG